MKKYLLLILPLLVLTSEKATSQPLDNGVHAIACLGYTLDDQPAMSFELAGNLNRLFIGGNIMVDVKSLSKSPLLTGKVGLILGRYLTFVPYLGASYTSHREVDGKALKTKPEIAYGFFLSTPTNWERTTIVAGANLSGTKDPNITSSFTVGFKVRLGKLPECN